MIEFLYIDGSCFAERPPIRSGRAVVGIRTRISQRLLIQGGISSPFREEKPDQKIKCRNLLVSESAAP